MSGLLHLVLFMAGLLLFSCGTKKPTPPLEQRETSTPQRHPKITKQRVLSPETLFAAYDKCTKYQYCKALDHLNLYFSSRSRSENYRTLTKALANGSSRVQAFALFRLYSYKDDLALVPHLISAFEKSTDKKVSKLALTLLFLNGSEKAVEAIRKRWGQFPKQLKMEVVWVIRRVANNLPMEFIDLLAVEKLPALRALALEVKVKLTLNIDQLVTCVQELTSESGFCARALSRFENEQIVVKTIALFDFFHNKAKKTRRRLNPPRELLTTLEKLVLKKRISENRGFDLAYQVLKNRRFSDRFRARAAFFLGTIGGKRARIALERFRRDRRKRVGYAARRAIYLMRKEG